MVVQETHFQLEHYENQEKLKTILTENHQPLFKLQFSFLFIDTFHFIMLLSLVSFCSISILLMYSFARYYVSCCHIPTMALIVQLHSDQPYYTGF